MVVDDWDTAEGKGSKLNLIRQVQNDSMRMVTVSVNAVLVRSPTTPYHVYHVGITNEFYRQTWVVCKRYSELHRMRKKLLASLKKSAEKKCSHCREAVHRLKELEFPKKHVLFGSDKEIVQQRRAGIEEYITHMCLSLSTASVCRDLYQAQYEIKEYLHFPIEHEKQHIRAIKSLEYVTNSSLDLCPICLVGWNDLEVSIVQSLCGHQFHETCLNEWFRTRFDCPLCRSNTE